MTGAPKIRDRTWIALLAFGLVAVLGVFARPVLPVDETRYLAVAWETWLHGNWLVPRLNGAPYAHKPPLLFWLINLVWSMTGVSDIPARLVAPAAGFASIWATSRLARALWPGDPGIGGRAAMILAGTSVFTLYAGLTMFDTLLGLAVLGGVFAILRGGQTRRGWIGLGVALAAGGIAKGPVILIHLLPVALAAPLWAGIPARRMLTGLGLAIATGVALIALWLVPAAVLGGPEYRAAVLWTQTAGRVSSSLGHARPWWFFLPLVPALLWPFGWSPTLWRRLAGLAPRTDRSLRLPLIWAGSALVLFSIVSGKQAHYLVPTLPAVALILARAAGETRFPARLAAAPLVVIGLACLGAALGLVGGDAAILLRPRLLAALIGLGFLGCAWLAWRLRGTDLLWVGLLPLVLVNLLFLYGAPGRIYDPVPIASFIAPADGAGIAVLGDEYNGEFTFAARLRNPVATLTPDAAGAWLAADPGRVLVARRDRPAPAGEPAFGVVYRGHPYGVWRGSQASAAK
ncbi:ArnT family glycosyltransferase [Amaricoccus solimangrovi]|uniref:Glycosyltransferase RgtA/B/C/D-like domain-containing protein n=1 Tax=Amaricoccus solimangrovi TaxID=2589815 RepID=A0A501WQA0_9RHOB|nr:glycosyltransferase family 39 protein [Amaricoccus solimangrovi]TPE51032.1 hypothetical protein FJM51_10385 [Amaricoccus solimangrovi]